MERIAETGAHWWGAVARGAKQLTRDRDTLLLAARQGGSALANDGVKPVWQVSSEAERAKRT